MQESKVLSRIAARNIKPFVMKDINSMDSLYKLGISVNAEKIEQLYGMDALTPTITAGSITMPAQFGQAWMPGFVETVTTVRVIDDLVGMTIIGDWADSEVIMTTLEPTGSAVDYGDNTNIPLASWNLEFARRSINVGELGFMVGVREEERAAKVKVSAAQAKRDAVSSILDIRRNQIGFVGYNSGNTNTYGILNDPYIGAYVTVATNAGATSTLWVNKTFKEITGDILTAVSALLTQSGGRVDAYKDETTLAVSLAAYSRLSTTTDFGISVKQWIRDTFDGKVRVVAVPQFDAANGGANVFYLFADKVNESGTDGGRVFEQMVQTRLRTIGVERLAKGYKEDYSNATAGVICKRPYAVVRYSGI